MSVELLRLMRAALEHESQAFEADAPIDGADFLDWFADWRERVKAALAQGE
jgi:hypothetical protein